MYVIYPAIKLAELFITTYVPCILLRNLCERRCVMFAPKSYYQIEFNFNWNAVQQTKNVISLKK